MATSDAVSEYAREHSSCLHPVQKKLIEATLQQQKSFMLSSYEELQFLQNIVSAMNAKKTLDIGVYTGYSALSVALALPDDGKVVACDIDEFAKFGKPFWEEAGVSHKIDLHIAPATETLGKLIDNGESGTYDFAFIDADKPNYMNYYECCLKLVRKNGLIALDNVLWNGRVVDKNPTDDRTKDIQAVNDFIAKDSRVVATMLTVGDGTTIARKL